MTTYGEHQEDTAAALTKLLAGRTPLPVDQDSIDTVLHCRNIIRDDARNRLVIFGAGPRARHSNNLGHIEHGPIGVLANALDRMPASGAQYIAGGLSPLDALRDKPNDPTAYWWSQAASSHLLATHQLATTRDRDDWVKDDGSLWHLVGDSANVVEALATLDSELVEVGLLHSDLSPSDHDQIRADVSYVAKAATWYTTNPGADYAHSRFDPHITDDGVQLISDVDDLAAAQRTLAGAIKPLSAGNAFTTEPRINAAEALSFVTTQTQTLRRFAEAARGTPGAGESARGFDVLAADLARTRPEIRRLVDVEPVPSRTQVKNQLQELGARTAALARDDKLRNLSPGQFVDLLHASRQAVVAGARAIHLEGTGKQSNLRLYSLDDAPTHIRMHHHSRLDNGLVDIINTHGAAAQIPRWSPSQQNQRTALRQTLDNTPTSAQPHYPSPRGRDDFGR